MATSGERGLLLEPGKLWAEAA